MPLPPRNHQSILIYRLSVRSSHDTSTSHLCHKQGSHTPPHYTRTSHSQDTKHDGSPRCLLLRGGSVQCVVHLRDPNALHSHADEARVCQEYHQHHRLCGHPLLLHGYYSQLHSVCGQR
ncbi:hypothetical protein E2C01_080626 [Portunus trituberculatus]|uniref:Uncharacterized protein n=1 Tax=Portunus trituberculatus TaxID=210409 RepID=A0A5B7IYV6_PORTR|nr:hypothetical protein [Portunus trituberculatus]